jgi:hypothetical protein
VGVYLVGSSVWQGRPSLRRRRAGLDQTGRCRCISDSLLVYRSKIPPAITMHGTIARKHNSSLVTSALVDECQTEGSHGFMSISSILKCSDDYLPHIAPHERWERETSASIDTSYVRKETQPVPQSLLYNFSICKRWVIGYKHRIIVNEHLVLLGYDIA